MGKTPRDVANEAEALVVPLPQRVLSALLLLSLSARDGEAPSEAEAVRAIKQASDYLSTRFRAEYKTAASAISDELAAAQRALTCALEGFARLPKAGDEIPAEGFGNMLCQVEDDLAPAVSAFLDTLFSDVVSYEKATAKQIKELDSSSLNDIEDIAKRINLIAINASVEAARAGDVGRGFGVIATEIKDLSQQSKEAVERIRTELG